MWGWRCVEQAMLLWIVFSVLNWPLFLSSPIFSHWRLINSACLDFQIFGIQIVLKKIRCIQVCFVFMLKKSTGWTTLDLCLSFHKELLQDGSITMLVLQLPSGSLAGQKPHVYLRFSKVCESHLCTTPYVLALQDADLWTLVVSTVLLLGDRR